MLQTFDEAHADDGPEGLEGWFKRLAKTIAVDFDGVIHPYSAGWVGSKPADEPPMPGALEFLRWCRDEGYQVVIFSTRADHEEGFKGICDWLTDNDLYSFVERVTHHKPPAVAYVDDRAVPYLGNWEDVKIRVTGLAGGRPHGAAQ